MNILNNNQQSCAKLSSSILPASYNGNKLFFTILFLLYFFLMSSSFIWAIDQLFYVSIVLGLFALILLSTRIRQEHVPIYIFVGFLVTSFLVSSFVVGRAKGAMFFPFLFMVSNFGIAMILLRGYVYSWAGYLVFYSLVVYFLSFMLAGVNVRFVMEFCSWNNISMLMLVACISLYIILSMENKKIDLKPAVVTLIISIWAVGRSGIISSFVLLLGLIFIKFRSKPKYIVIIYLFIASLICAFLMLSSDYFLSEAANANAIRHLAESMARGQSERWPIWTNYYNNLDISRVIFGVNVAEDPWPEGERLAYNYHNSFIFLHAQTGFMGLITSALIIFSIFKFYRTDQVFFILLLTLILRSSTDVVFFFSRFDFIPFFFIFYFLKRRPFRVPHMNPHCRCQRNIVHRGAAMSG